MKTSFHTIAAPAEGMFKDRGSKFLAFAFPVRQEEEIRGRLETLRRQYHDARHHCYAWKLGTDPANSRANDDGEPSNSAGKPILNQIEKHELTDILVVVVRYFGGTLLGMGGLITAYRSAAGDALDKCRIIEVKVCTRYRLRFDYVAMNEVMKVIKEHSLATSGQEFGIHCSAVVDVELEQETRVLEKLGLVAGCSYVRIENKL